MYGTLWENEIDAKPYSPAPSDRAGRVKINIATQLNITACKAKTQSGTLRTADKTKTRPIDKTATPLALGVIAPCSCQFLIKLPKTLWLRSQRCSRGDERAKAKAAISKNTVVGIKGRTTPIAAKPTQMSPRQSQDSLLTEYFLPLLIMSIIV